MQSNTRRPANLSVFVNGKKINRIAIGASVCSQITVVFPRLDSESLAAFFFAASYADFLANLPGSF